MLAKIGNRERINNFDSKIIKLLFTILPMDY